MNLELQELIQQQQKINTALLSKLEEALPKVEEPVGCRSLLEERLENDRLVDVLRTQGVAQWKAEHKKVMRARRDQLRVPLAARPYRRKAEPKGAA